MNKIIFMIPVFVMSHAKCQQVNPKPIKTILGAYYLTTGYNLKEIYSGSYLQANRINVGIRYGAMYNKNCLISLKANFSKTSYFNAKADKTIKNIYLDFPVCVGYNVLSLKNERVIVYANIGIAPSYLIQPKSNNDSIGKYFNRFVTSVISEASVMSKITNKLYLNIDVGFRYFFTSIALKDKNNKPQSIYFSSGLIYRW